jgi:spore germination protein GerM
MKAWIIGGAIVVLLLALWIWSQGGVFIQGTPGTTTDEEVIDEDDDEDEETETGGVDTVKVALIALEDNGAKGKLVGCGDSVVLVDRKIDKTVAPLRAALVELLSINDQDASGYYTALDAADLELDNVRIENGKATIELSGTLSLGGVCDSPRVKAQLEETALQFPTVTSVNVMLNGETLEEAMSMQ